jgi:hypothetical protein
VERGKKTFDIPAGKRAISRLLDGLNSSSGLVYRKIEIESGKVGKTRSEIMRIRKRYAEE